MSDQRKGGESGVKYVVSEQKTKPTKPNQTKPNHNNNKKELSRSLGSGASFDVSSYTLQV
jgi:hypothetical protein